MYQLNLSFSHMMDAAQFVQRSEDAYEQQLEAVKMTILRQKTIQFLTITGPTCSGKTTTSSKLSTLLEKAGRTVFPVSLDDFYRDRENLPRLPDGRTDYDTAAAIDLPYLEQCIHKLILEQEIRLPHFNFRTGKRDGYLQYIPHNRDIVVLEGIQAIYPEVRSLLPEEQTVSLAVMPADHVHVGDVIFDRREIRLLRRLVRDAETRGADAADTFSMWEDVCKNEDRSILPYLGEVDIFINTFLPYELSVIRPFAEDVLRCMPKTGKYDAIAENLMARLSVIPVIDASLVPADSMFREFIG